MTDTQQDADLTVAIIAGGKSSRMVLDKTALLWRGQTLLQHAASQALLTGLNVIVVGQIQPSGWPFQEVDFVQDDQPNQGPIGGIATALGSVSGNSVLAIAADMPLIDHRAISWLADQSRRSGSKYGVLARSANGIEPLFSVYTPAISPVLLDCMERGMRSLHKLADIAEFEILGAPDFIGRALVNINTPEEWSSLQAQASE